MLLLLACTSASKPDTGAPDDTAPPDASNLTLSRACLLPADAVPAEYTRASYIVEVSGRVTAVGTGPPANGCRDRGEWIGGSPLDWNDSDSRWLQIEEPDGDVWLASATNPWLLDPTPLETEEVTLSYRSLLGAPDQTEMAFEGPEFEFYLGVADALTSLAPPSDITLAAGDIELEYDDDCGHHARRALSAARDEDLVEIATDETAGFDGIGVWSGGIIEDITLSCTDAPSAYAAVFEWVVP